MGGVLYSGTYLQYTTTLSFLRNNFIPLFAFFQKYGIIASQRTHTKMHYSKYGLINTKKIFQLAISNGFSVPAFNVYNMETISAVLNAATVTNSPTILAISESALKYMGDNNLIGLISAQKIKQSQNIVLHLDHGSSFESCKHAIDIGFSSVMIDASKLSLTENIALTGCIVEYAHKFDVSVESELGILSGIEDENTFSDQSLYTNPLDAKKFVDSTDTDSLAVAIGTSHGAYKRTNKNEKLRFDILSKIESEIPNTPIVLHGASIIPQEFIKNINEFGGNIQNAIGTDIEQLQFASKQTHICKINIDSDLRLAMTSAIRHNLFTHPENFNPRQYLADGTNTISNYCAFLIREVMFCENKNSTK